MRNNKGKILGGIMSMIAGVILFIVGICIFDKIPNVEQFMPKEEMMIFAVMVLTIGGIFLFVLGLLLIVDDTII